MKIGLALACLIVTGSSAFSADTTMVLKCYDGLAGPIGYMVAAELCANVNTQSDINAVTACYEKAGAHLGGEPSVAAVLCSKVTK